MIKEIDLNNEVELKEGNVYIVTRFNRNTRSGRDPLFKLGNKFSKKCLFSTTYTKTYLSTSSLFSDWKNEILVSYEYNDNFFEHEVFQHENIYIVCSFYHAYLDTNIQDQLIKIAKDKKSTIVLKGCDLLDVDSQKNKEKLGKYLVRGKTITKEEMYKAAGLFLLDDKNVDLKINIPNDILFRNNRRNREILKFNTTIIEDYLKDDHKALGMCGPYDHDEEYRLEPNKCHMALQFMDPPIARLCKIIGSMGFRTVYSCVNHQHENEGTIFSLKFKEDVEKLLLILNVFESDLIYFDSIIQRDSWLGNKVMIKQKRPEFIVDDAYFWELQRLGDFLQAQVGVNFPLSFQSSYRPQSN